MDKLIVALLVIAIIIVITTGAYVVGISMIIVPFNIVNILGDAILVEIFLLLFVGAFIS